MAENEPLTPEKQLLKLIENPKQGDIQQKTKERQVKSWFSFSAVLSRLAFWKAFSGEKVSAIRKSKSGAALKLKQINLVLKFAIFFLTVYLGYSIFVMAVELQKTQNLIFPKPSQLPVESEQAGLLKGLRHYQDVAGNRALTTFGQMKEQEEAKPIPISIDTNEKFKVYELVGIAWSDEPEAMIENTVLKQTFFVKRGDTLDSGVTVGAIFRDKVVLQDGKKEFELS